MMIVDHKISVVRTRSYVQPFVDIRTDCKLVVHSQLIGKQIEPSLGVEVKLYFAAHGHMWCIYVVGCGSSPYMV